MFIIQCLNHAADSPSLKLAALAFCCVQLRDAISYFSRVEITEHEEHETMPTGLSAFLQYMCINVKGSDPNCLDHWLCNT